MESRKNASPSRNTGQRRSVTEQSRLARRPTAPPSPDNVQPQSAVQPSTGQHARSPTTVRSTAAKSRSPAAHSLSPAAQSRSPIPRPASSPTAKRESRRLNLPGKEPTRSEGYYDLRSLTRREPVGMVQGQGPAREGNQSAGSTTLRKPAKRDLRSPTRPAALEKPRSPSSAKEGRQSVVLAPLDQPGKRDLRSPTRQRPMMPGSPSPTKEGNQSASPHKPAKRDPRSPIRQLVIGMPQSPSKAGEEKEKVESEEARKPSPRQEKFHDCKSDESFQTAMS